MSGVERLDALGWALAEMGWRVVIRYGEARLWASPRSALHSGEVVSITSVPDGLWFWGNAGGLLARGDDLQGALESLERLLRPA
ncbi:hypothetical protein [Spirillospora sp. NPDC029432]|uniref:hypothetical protein n=1 Tax=Spirillospora sp. NPDC029432 TaxID=3154599 RepID=UPI003454314C